MASREGLIEFNPPAVSHPCFIWYNISGPWPAQRPARPLVVLHGGPGYTHDYMLPLEDLCKAPYNNTTVIFFDQLGSGRSTHLPEKLTDSDFWCEQLFLNQVTAVLGHLSIQDDYDLLGHSWGGMLATIHAARQPQGLKRLVIAHSPVSSDHWTQKYKEFREAMPEPHRTILMETRTMQSRLDTDYLKALHEFYRRHFIKLDLVPPELEKSWNEIENDPTVSLACLGPDEFDMTGFVADFTAIDEVQNITAKTLVVNGLNEGSDHEESIKIFKRIPDCQHVVFQNSVHFAHLEERKEFMTLISTFLETG